jgi:NADP-dependent aldehyde dehydrogenase
MPQPIWIEGNWQPPESPAGAFQAVSPVDGAAFGDLFPISSFKDVQAAVLAGCEAAAGLRRLPPEPIALFLNTYAALIERQASILAQTASRETGLPAAPRLQDSELPRTCDQLRQAAEAVRDRSWRTAVIDRRLNIRSWYGPLGGPVVILGPNNFPLAFNSISGGDFAAALAAGNPVIAKGHPGHPNTTRLLAESAAEALNRSGLPRAAVQLIYHMNPEDGLRLAAHPGIGALAFTGSRRAGLLLKQAAEEAGNPTYLEMSGINPVILLPHALQERGEEIAAELSTSCTLGAGQFCTNPGLVILIKDEWASRFLKTLAENLAATPRGTVVNRQVLTGWSTALKELQHYGAEIITGGEAEFSYPLKASSTLLQVSAKTFLAHSHELQTEAFGPSTLAVLTQDSEELRSVVSSLEGNLTGSIYSHSRELDDELYSRVAPVLRTRVGRLLNDKMPTGVAVSPAMHHGGPFPATGHPGFTSVGIPRSMLRFTALQCYDNVRPLRLPPELQDTNPTGRMWRNIDGTWTQSNI